MCVIHSFDSLQDAVSFYRNNNNNQKNGKQVMSFTRAADYIRRRAVRCTQTHKKSNILEFREFEWFRHVAAL